MNTQNQEIMGYNKEANTPGEHAENALFQLSNVEGYMSIKDYESALIKAELAVESLRLAAGKTDITVAERDKCYFCETRSTGYSMVKLGGIESLEPTCNDHAV